MQKNQWTGKPYSQEMLDEMFSLLQACDNATDYHRTHRMITTELGIRRNRPERGVSNARHENTRLKLEDALAKIELFDEDKRPGLEAKLISEHNQAVDEVDEKLNVLTKDAVEATKVLLDLCQKMVAIQEPILTSSQIAEGLNRRGIYGGVRKYRVYKTAWGFQFDSQLPPRELMLQLAKALVLRTDAYSGDANLVATMPPAVKRFSHVKD